MKYKPYTQSITHCKTNNFQPGGDNVIAYGKLISAITLR